MSIHTVLSVVGNSIFATPETLARMPYLKACLRETPPISCIYPLRYPAKTERRHNSRGATISLGALFKLSSLFTKWGEMRVFFKMPKRSNRRYHFDRIGRSFRFSSIWIRNTHVPRWTYCRVRASSANGQNRAAV